MSGKFGEHKVEINKTSTSSEGKRKEIIKAQPMKTVALNEEYNCANEFFQESNRENDGIKK